MYKRKCNWCVFKDGHKERIIDYVYFSSREIGFITKRGKYLYLNEEIIETGPPPYYIRYMIPSSSLLSPTYFRKWKYPKFSCVSIYGEDPSNYILDYSIDRIELVKI